MGHLTIVFLLAYYFIANDIICDKSAQLSVPIGHQIQFKLSQLIQLPSSNCKGLILTSFIDNIYIGTINPRRFTCDNDRLIYTHFGSHIPSLQNINILLQTDKHITRNTISIKIIKINEKNYELNPIIIPEAGAEIRINRKHFLYKGDSIRCKVEIVRPPKHGALLLAKPDLNEYDCKEISSGSAISYNHFPDGHDIDSFLLKITADNVTFHHQMQVFVREGAIANNAPRSLNISTLNSLKSTDDITASAKLFYTILKLPNGVNIKSSFSGQNINDFFQGDLPGIPVLYSKKDISGNLCLQVMDDEGAKRILEMKISITPLLRKFMQTSVTGITLMEGSKVELKNFPKLKVEDASNFNISVLNNGPKFGKILLDGWATRSFTLAEVLSGSVHYQNIKPGVWDPLLLNIEYKGEKLQIVYPIAIMIQDIRHPILKPGNPLVVKKNVIKLGHLLAEDSDSASDEIHYHLQSVIYGGIFLRKSIDEEIAITEWTQKDMADGRIIYKVIARPQNGGTDLLKLKLSDEAVPPNVSPVYHIKIRILADEEPPRLVTNYPLKVGNLAVKLTGLIYKDVWPPKNITYSVYERSLRGRILNEAHGTAVTEFTQDQLDKGLIYYEPPAIDILQDDEIHFNVSDGDRNTLTNQILKLEWSLPSTRRYQQHSQSKEEEVNILYVDEGDSIEITEETLGLKDSLKNQTFLVEQLPKYGEILVFETPSKLFNISQILSRDVCYVHNAEEIGKTKLYDNFVIKFLEEQREIFVSVVIRPVDDFPPEIYFKSKIIVFEGKQALITQEHISIIDKDTADIDIRCYITAPPLFGIVNSTFTYRDIIDSKVFYIQSIHKKIEQSDDSFSIICNDKYNNSRNNYGTIPIEIVAVNDEAPVVTARNITEKKIALSRVITVCDMDTPLDRITLSLIKAPDKGIVMSNGKLPKKLNNFTFSDLKDIFYENWESGEDNFIIAVTDGQFITEVLIKVWINEVSPKLIINEGLDVKVGSTELITEKQLFAEDIDTPASDVMFIIKHAPMYGSIYLNRTELHPGFKFSQNDLSFEFVSYKHTDRTSFMDVFVFDLTDGVHTVENENFFITIRDYNVKLKVTSQSPVLEANTSLLLTTNLINVSNINEDHTKINFVVMNNLKYGHIEYITKPNEPIKSFTLDDLENNLLQYVNTITISSTSPEIIQFEVNTSVQRIFHSFTIIIRYDVIKTVEPLQDTTEPSLPELIYNKPIRSLYQVNESFATVITAESLLARYNERYDVIYNVTVPPKFGHLYNIKLQATCNSFTQDDINNSLIYYILNKDEKIAATDGFIFDILGQNSAIRDLKFTLEWSWVNFRNTEILTTDIGEYKIEILRDGSTMQSAFVELELEEGNTTSEYYLENNEIYFSAGQKVAHTFLFIKKYKRTDELEVIVVGIKKVDNLVKRTPDRVHLILVTDVSEEPHETTTLHQEIDYITENLIHFDENRLVCSPQNDTYFQFSREEYNVKETDGFISAEIIRSGDIFTTSSVICYTSENFASSDDFVPRSRNRSSEVIFLPGKTREKCVVKILNDEIYEREEDFTINLKCTNKSVKLKRKLTSTVFIHDQEDEEIIRFEKSHYFIREPVGFEKNVSLKIRLLRQGDTTYGRHVKVTALDGSAKSEEDYVAKQTVIGFEPKNKLKYYEVFILKDNLVESRESFSLRLEMLAGGNTKKNHQATIYISDGPQPGSDVFPVPPTVISLKDYNNSKDAYSEPVQGYPLVCITVCDSNHQLYRKYQNWCKIKEINPKDSIYHWQIENLHGEMIDISSVIFFANTSLQTLDSIYFRGGYRIRCGARPVVRGIAGKELFSTPVTINLNQGICPPPKQNMLGAEPFISNIHYTELNGDKIKGIRITVTLPHYDGIFPAISTHPIEDTKQILISYAMRSEIHQCSNLILNKELKTTNGFISYNESPPMKSYQPYEHNLIRGSDILTIYKHLDLKTCIWNFEAYFTLSEIKTYCGAKILSENNIENEEASLILELPLYVSYISTSHLGWQHIDSVTTLKLQFTYKTSSMKRVDMNDQQVSTYDVHLSATNMYISANGSLVVYFKTVPKFVGFYLYEIPGREISKVENLDRPELQLMLTLLGNLTEGESIEQAWKFCSEVASIDYSGTYEITLIPCVSASSHQSCIPRTPVRYTLDVQFQQTGDPILHKYTLDTDFQLIKGDVSTGADTSTFQPGDYVHGIIAVVPPQDDIALQIEKCYLCSGKNGHIPKYNPDEKEFGCLMETSELQHSLKLVDRENMESVYNNKYFNATFSKEICFILLGNSLENNIKNCDGFSFDTTPLFRQHTSKIWYIQCTFTINLNNRNRFKRTVNIESDRILSEQKSTSIRKKGTNMHILMLKEPESESEILSPRIQSSAHGVIAEQLSINNLFQLLIIALVIIFCIGISMLSCSISRLKKQVQLSATVHKYNNVGYTPCQDCVTSL